MVDNRNYLRTSSDGIIAKLRNGSRLASSEDGPIIMRRYADLFEQEESRQYPLTSAGRWLLITHTFGLPRLRSNSKSWRFRMPLVAKALQLPREGWSRPRGTKIWKKAEEYLDCLDLSCEECEHRGCGYDQMELEAAKFLAGTERLAKVLRELDPVQFYMSDTANEYLNGDGRGLVSRLIGELVGHLDLVLIDEAHKSRSAVDDPRTLLGWLLQKVLIRRRQGRRLAMTATPVELSADQWRDILGRIGVSAPPDKQIEAFVKAHRQAIRHPDQALAIQNLLSTSSDFENALRPHVTRRRRIMQKDMVDLVGPPDHGMAHPHRELSAIKIAYESISEDWRPVVLALEGLGKAAKGLGGEANAARLADIRYAAGHLTTEMTGGTNGVDVDPDEDAEPWRTGKRLRMKFWEKLIAKQLGTGAGPKSVEEALADHPRIASVADHIEKVVWGKEGEEEKVLVFGVFRAPLRSLRYVLNWRAVLRLLDRGLPVPGLRGAREDLGPIWGEYLRILTRIRQGDEHPQPFSDRLKEGLTSPDNLASLIEDAGRRYERIRDNLQDQIDGDFLKSLPGDYAIGKLEREDCAALAQLLRTRVVNEWLCQPGVARMLASGGRSALEARRVAARSRAREIWAEYLQCHVEMGQVDADAVAETGWTNQEDLGDKENANLQELDRLGDHVPPEAIRSLIAEESTQGGDRFSDFARSMNGSTSMQTRRVVQAQFNRRGFFPRVLLAQSQVGREGLNLHEACRHVVLFHSEWNPAVVEQQIGRVDRIESLWEDLAKDWKNNGADPEKMPKILVDHVVFEGTYDEYQAHVYEARRRNLNAQLFGELLDAESLSKVPADLAEDLANAAPDFAPPSRTAQ